MQLHYFGTAARFSGNHTLLQIQFSPPRNNWRVDVSMETDAKFDFGALDLKNRTSNAALVLRYSMKGGGFYFCFKKKAYNYSQHLQEQFCKI